MIERAMVLSRNSQIESDDFPGKIRQPSASGGENADEDRIYTLAEMERI